MRKLDSHFPATLDLRNVENSTFPSPFVNLVDSDLSERLRQIRMERGYSKQDLADRAGLSSRTVRDLENRKRDRVQEKTILLLAGALEVEPAFLLAPEAKPDSEKTDPRRFRAILLFNIILLSVAVVIGISWAFSSRHTEFKLVHGNLIAHDTFFHREAWSKKWQANASILIETPWHKDAILVGLDGSAADGGRVLIIDRKSGRVIIELKPDYDAVRSAFGEKITAGGLGFSVGEMQFLNLDGTGSDELLVRYTHNRFFPAVLAVYGQNGNQRGHYISRGHITDIHIEDLDGDGRDEIIAAGTNNSLVFQGGTLIRLEEDFWSGATFDAVSGGKKSVPDSAAFRLVIPSFGETCMKQLGRVRMSARAITTFRNPTGELMISATFTPRDMGVIVTCDAELHPVSVTASDAFIGEITSWQDNECLADGFPDQDWLDAWMESGFHFKAGHWPQ